METQITPQVKAFVNEIESVLDVKGEFSCPIYGRHYEEKLNFVYSQLDGCIQRNTSHEIVDGRFVIKYLS